MISDFECLDLLYQGIAQRKVSATKMNDSSSRSHAIFTVHLDIKITKPIIED